MHETFFEAGGAVSYVGKGASASYHPAVVVETSHGARVRLIGFVERSAVHDLPWPQLLPSCHALRLPKEHEG